MNATTAETIDDDLIKARQIAKLGQKLAEFKFNLELTDLLLPKDARQRLLSSDEWQEQQQYLAWQSVHLNREIRALGDNGHLRLPSGFAFVICPKQTTIEGSQFLNNRWMPSEATNLSVSRPNEGVSGTNFIKAPQALVIANEAANSVNPGALYAYEIWNGRGLKNRYDISSDTFDVHIMTSLSHHYMYVVSDEKQNPTIVPAK